jgi:hypothetical protein
MRRDSREAMRSRNSTNREPSFDSEFLGRVERVSCNALVVRGGGEGCVSAWMGEWGPGHRRIALSNVAGNVAAPNYRDLAGLFLPNQSLLIRFSPTSTRGASATSSPGMMPQRPKPPPPARPNHTHHLCDSLAANSKFSEKIWVGKASSVLVFLFAFCDRGVQWDEKRNSTRRTAPRAKTYLSTFKWKKAPDDGSTEV